LGRYKIPEHPILKHNWVAEMKMLKKEEKKQKHTQWQQGELKLGTKTTKDDCSKHQGQKD
jgi:DNA-directed RNA polymerase subunit H (RpoH/RPB5)